MKAILVIDMPDMCNECPMCSADTGFLGDITRSECRISNRDNMVYLDGMAVPVWCPLKPLPRKLDANDWHRMFGGTYKEREAKGYGWNACLEEIEK